MTHFLRKMAAAWIILGSVSVGFAQQQMPPIPTDPNVRIGNLDNGLTYYIRHNELPEKRADFYIAQKVGSILEEDNQRGLAHFLEHMCFNGTKNFPDKTLIQYLESIGVKFGENLNAYTSIDETVYNISNVPVIRDGVVDSCLLILHDWADDLTLDPKEIDSERGVIHEEWRTSTNAMMRMYEKALPTLYPESKYAYRLPIGIMEVVDNFPYQALRDYYEKWYRPDQQGIVVVGDIDVDKIEAKIKKIFSPIKMPENPAEREYFQVPDNKETIVAIETDKEQANPVAYLCYKHEAIPNEQKGNMDYLVVNYMKSMIENMLNARLNELTQTANPPFTGAGAGYGEYFLAKTKESAALAVFLLGTMYGASPKDDNEEKRIPVFLFGGAEEWYRKEFGRSTEAGFKAEKQNVADALLSFMYGSFEDRRRYEAALNAITDEEKKKVFMEEWQDGRTSMKNIGEYAHQLGEKLKGKVKCCIDDTTKVNT